MKRQELLERAGLRRTKQRELIIDILEDGGDHLDADEVYRIARRRRPDISLSTVYRTLRALKDSDLIEEHQFDEGHHHYEVRRADHHHLICTGCGAVIEFRFPIVSILVENVRELSGVEIESANLAMKGLCSRCKEEA